MNKENIKKFFKGPFTISFIVVSFILVYVIFNIITTPNDFKTILKFTNEINLINNKNLEKSSHTSNFFIDECNKNISELKSIQYTLESAQVKSDITSHKKLLLEILNTNISLYENIILFLENPSDNILEKNQKIIKLKLELDKLLVEATSLKLELKLTSDNTTLSSMLSYINEIVKINRDSALTKSSLDTFKLELENIYTKFSPLNENLFDILKIVEAEGNDISSVLETVNENIKTLNILNNELHSLSVPSNCSELFNSLNSVFESYDIYIKSLRDYLVNAIAGTKDSIMLDLAEQNYSETNAKIINYLKIYENTKQ